MAELLLKSLQDQDIDWLINAGQRHNLNTDAVAIQQGATVDALHVILRGQMISAVADDTESTLGKAFSAITENANLEHELFSLGDGDVFGETAITHQPNSPMMVRAVGPTTVLTVPQSRLEPKLAEDFEFASRFYWAMATLLFNRYELLLDKYAHRRGLRLSSMQQAPAIFGELLDGDVDWMITQGSIRRLEPEEQLIQAGRPADGFYVVLQGALSTEIATGRSSALTQIFSQIADGPCSEPAGREVARSFRGGVAGETILINPQLWKFAVRAAEPAIVLAIPQRELSIKLQQDTGMASRFYRGLTMLLSERLTRLINHLGYRRTAYRSGQPPAASGNPKDELDLDLVDHLTLGGARFDWMLKRLEVESL